jgi:hypothetical protein
MSVLKKYPLYIILFAVFFCLHGTVENFGFVYIEDCIAAGKQVLIGTVLFFSIFLLISRKVHFAGIISFFIASWYFFFGAIKDGLTSSLPFISGYSVLLPLLLIITILLGLVIRKKTILQEKITLYLNILLIIYCLLDAGILTFKNFNKKEIQPDTSISFNVDVVKEKPNVYFLLFDEYAGYKNLQDSFGFKNDNFYNHLKEKGFVELPISPNYAMTTFCMASIFNMQYVQPLRDTNNMTFVDYQDRLKEIKNATVFNSFEKMGYAVHNFSIFDVKAQKSLETNSFILNHSQLLNHKMLHNRILKDLSHLFLFGKYGINFFRKLVFNENAVYNTSVENGLSKILEGKNKKPNFVYAHFLMPHSPILFDSLGNRIPDEIVAKNTITPPLTKGLYLSYLKYTNTKIIHFSDEIIKKDSSAIVVIMSDHGYRDWLTRNEYQPYSFNNMCFVRNINKEVSIPTAQFTNVNFFRLFFNEYYNQSIPYVKDSVGLYLFH